ncbi:MAG: bacterial Ig-like domain-containing protein [Clostridia bacterium]|nr:bacterial Ig-like domain-containing protein [Clostridia bacterium]
MKRVKFFTALIFVCLLAFCAVACNLGEKIDKIEIKSGTVATEITVGDTLDTSSLTVTVYFADGTTKEVSGEDLTIGQIDTASVGQKVLTVTYKDLEAKININVKAAPVVNPNSTLDIIAVKSDLKLEYTSNIANKVNKEEQFANQADGYYVGDDNEFIYKPRAEEASKGYPRSISEDLLDMEISLSVMDEDGGFNNVANAGTYVTTNGYGMFDFNEEAIGKTFSLTVIPFVKEFRETTNSRNVSETITFTVIDGWNAYTVADLSMIDNRSESSENEEEAARAAAWNTYKTEKGLPVDVAPNAVIMHSDMTVTASDIPSIFFYNEGDEDIKSSDDDVRGVEGYVSPVGSLRDYEDIYNRYVGADKTFAFIGNYFTLNAETVPVVIRENGDLTKAGDVQGHSQLIRFHGDRGVPSDKTIGKVDMKNIYILGNANRTENMLAGGGLISHKARNVDATIQNVIAREWYITFFSEADGENGVPDTTLYTVKDSKAYDNFNSFVYVWGGQNNTFEDCEMIGAGGPVMIVDHVLGKDNGTEATDDDRPDSPADVKIRNCNLKSIVTGTEGWFQSFEATPLAAALKDLNGLFTQYGKSILVSGNGTITGNIQSDVYFNLVVITKSGSAQGMTFEQIANSIQIDDGQPLDFGTKASEDTNSYMLKAHLDGLLGFEAPLKAVFQSSAGGVAFTDGQTPAPVRLTGMANPPYAPITDATDSVFDGDYLNTYIGGAGDGYMGAIFRYYDYNTSSAS